MSKNPNLDIAQHSTGKLTKQQNREVLTNTRGFVVEEEEAGCREGCSIPFTGAQCFLNAATPYQSEDTRSYP